MAARLMLRASRLLAVPVSFQPSSSSIPSECLRLGRIAPSPPCLAALHTSPLCRLTKNLPESLKQGGDDALWMLLSSMSGLEELLEASSQPNMSGNNGVLFLQHIAKRELDKKEIMNDKRMQRLMETVISQIQYVWNSRLIKLLKVVYSLELDRTNGYRQAVEIEVRWRMRKFSIESLSHLASFISPLFSSKDEKSLLDDLVRQVEFRWMEIKDTQTLSMLLSKLGFLSDSLMEKLEDKVLEFAENFTPMESRRIITVLATQKRRTLPVLRALSYHLSLQKAPISSPIILELAFTFSQLHFCYPPLLHKMAADILTQFPDLSADRIAKFIRSISTLKFFHQPSYDACAQAYVEKTELFSVNNLCYLLVGYATVNFCPSQSEAFFSVVDKHLSSAMNTLPWLQQLDAVWSLCVLGHASTQYFQKILVPQFYTQVLEDESVKSVSCALKLLHINATALLETPEHDGPLLPDDVLQALQDKILVRKSATQHRDIEETMKKIFPQPGACRFSIRTVYGCFMDCEVAVDSELKAVNLEAFNSSHNPECGEVQRLPEGVRRLAFLNWTFSSFVHREKILLGRNMMCRRHLRSAGFVVVEVPFYDWQDLKSDWQKQSYLQDQMRKAMAEETA